MLPVESEAKKTQIKILGFGLVEDPQYRHTGAESHLATFLNALGAFDHPISAIRDCRSENLARIWLWRNHTTKARTATKWCHLREPAGAPDVVKFVRRLNKVHFGKF
jgi:hypothetical protein